MKLGFIGLGNMGGPMCRNLIAAGHQMTVRDTDAAAEALCLEKGAIRGVSPQQVAEASEIVFASLPTPAAVEAVLWGEQGLLAGARQGQIFVDLSTNLPAFAQRVAAELEAVGVAALDAPIMGSPAQVEAKSTAVIVGGAREAYARVEPLLRECFRDVFYGGGPGAGLTIKLVGNLINYCNLGVAREALTLASRAGIERELLLQVLRTRVWDGSFWDFVGEKITDEHYESGYPMDIAPFKTSPSGLTGKSLAMALELSDSLDVPNFFGTLLVNLLREGKEPGPR